MKNLRARMYVATEVIIENKILLLYKSTSQIITEVLCKILTWQAFQDFKNIILRKNVDERLGILVDVGIYLDHMQ